MTVRSGEFVSEHLTATTTTSIATENIQPNGVDLRTAEVHRILTKDFADFSHDGYRKPERNEVEPLYPDYSGPQYWRLSPGRYAIVYDEEVHIPEGHVGRVYPRSRVMRSGLHLTSALWDQGYSGRGEGLLVVPELLDYVNIDVGEPLGQMVFMEAEEPDAFYDGSHQGERL